MRLNNSGVARTANYYLAPQMTDEFVEDKNLSASKRIGNPYNQRSYKLPNAGVRSENYGCAITTYLIAINLLSPNKEKTLSCDTTGVLNGSRNGAYCKWDYSDPSQNINYIPGGYKYSGLLDKMYESLAVYGKPVIFKISRNGRDSYHFVLVTGMKDIGTRMDRKEFYYSDFICADPNTGKACYLTEADGWNTKYLSKSGIKLFY